MLDTYRDIHMQKFADEKFGAGNWELVMHFPVLYEAWECDSDAWVIKADNQQILLMTNHGGMYIARAKELEERLAEYEKVSELTKQALQLIK